MNVIEDNILININTSSLSVKHTCKIKEERSKKRARGGRKAGRKKGRKWGNNKGRNRRKEGRKRGRGGESPNIEAFQ